MFNISEILKTIQEWKALVETNRRKNLRAEIAARILATDIATHETKEYTTEELKVVCETSVKVADRLLLALGETNA